MECGSGLLSEWYWHENQITQGKNLLQCHFPPQTPYGLEWDRNRDPADSSASNDDCSQDTRRIHIRQTTNTLHLEVLAAGTLENKTGPWRQCNSPCMYTPWHPVTKSSSSVHTDFPPALPLEVSSAIVQPIITLMTYTSTILRGPTKTLLNLNGESFQIPANTAHIQKFCWCCVLEAGVSKALVATGMNWECAEYEQQIGELYQFISHKNLVPVSKRTLTLQVLKSVKSSRYPQQNGHWRVTSDILPT
jgi:hypothetical protein